MKKMLLAASVIAAFGVSSVANASIAVVFDDFDDGFAAFNSTVVGAGGSVELQALGTNQSATYTDFIITRAGSGSTASVGGTYGLLGASPSRATTSGVIDIAPSGSSRGIGARNSGITFTFASGINALGFEVGDWATCCQPSDLYIQFGNNTPILVGASTAYGDQFLTNGGAGVFVAAFDDTDTFTQVTFWGDGFGEALYAGGTIRYSAIGVGTLPGVPEPTTWAMMIAGFGLAGAALRRRRASTVSFA